MQLYLFWRASSVPFIRRRFGWKLLVPIAIVLWMVLYAGRTLGHGGKGQTAVIIELLGMTWMATLFLMFMAMLAADLLTGFGFLLRRHAAGIRGWALLAGIALSLLAMIQGMRPPVISRHEVRLPGLPHNLDGTTIAAVSDMHIGSLIGPKWLRARVGQIQRLQPDLIMLLGDIFEGHDTPAPEIIDVLRGFSAPLGIWAVRGNHEHYGRIDDAAPGAAIRKLCNEWAQPVEGLVIAGVDDLTIARRNGHAEEAVDQALSGRPGGATVLLSHSPLQVQRAADHGAGLMLSGHTHGGQIWPFTYVVQRRYPLIAGRYQVDGMTAIISCGAGTWGPRMRLWKPGEILFITLRST